MGVSTHVLDAVEGRPRPGVPVRLESHDGTYIAADDTDTDGRIRDLAGWLPAGVYQLTFGVATPFYPWIVIVFEISDPDSHHHVPLLLSPYAYSTYRGS